MKKYKVWIEIEEEDQETGEHKNLTNSGEVSPVKLEEFDSLVDAKYFVDTIEWTLERWANSLKLNW